MRTKLERRMTAVLLPALLLAGTGTVFAQDGAPYQPLPADRTMDVINDGTKSVYKTGSAEGLSGAGHPFAPSETMGADSTNPSNLLPTIYGNALDSAGNEIPNTLPSTAENPYNLHPDPVVSVLSDDRGPEEDLARVIKRLKEATNWRELWATLQTRFRGGLRVPADPRRGDREVIGRGNGAGKIGERVAVRVDQDDVQFAIDILEGNEIDRVYSGMPLLNYKGPEQMKVVDPETKSVTVHQVWTRNAVMSDTFGIDPSNVLDEEWTIHYVIDVVARGHEDFAPFVMYFDDPNLRDGAAVPSVALDGTFFPMNEGKRYEFEYKMAPGRFWNLTYHWGWRVHPQRIQAIENTLKVAAGKTLDQWEIDVFGAAPSSSEEAKLAAISMIGDLAPAKRMWIALKALKEYNFNGRDANSTARLLVEEIEAAFFDWKNRNVLPRGVHDDPDSHVTLFYVNNTIYGSVNGHDGATHAQPRWDEWVTRGSTLKVKLLNGDYFPHAYMNIDFGGLRGWENTFHNTLPLNGQGPWFTFGRTNWMPNTINPAIVPPAELPEGGYTQNGIFGSAATMEGLGDLATTMEEARAMTRGEKATLIQQELLLASQLSSSNTNVDGLGEHDVEIEYRYDPAQRLRFYQFDPFHHGVAIWSVH
ncbi:hypothetical protein GCM10007972_03040 [Iodidimonas muriae]|uniref:Uncharacterized protein n=1 Tax=Iodidimonas muriae TaxID=261467 RepID=A0ABQ2L750_9PROT|nr:hypothetical protein [Iodidimonas muriae]GER06628.1 hypothetical protein JCM17843_09380 [Kordiimonadales bacterium JCM 17843]GGO05527.1 hypothetical protein GCM10007972_03040 [Iodidimonas muriae]